MSQASITRYFAIRTQKRKRLDDDNPSCKKPAIKSIKPVARLAFDDDGVASVRKPQPGPVPAPTLASAPAPAPTPTPSTTVKRTGKAAISGELAARLAAFGENCDRLKPKTESKSSLKDFGAIEMFVPTSPRKASPESPVKSPSKMPAYARFASLAEAAPTLILPLRYRWLAEAFRAIDTVSSMLHNRGETVTFAKIKPAAQEMLKRNLTERHLSQIKRLAPDMYEFSRTKSGNGHDLVLTPSLSGATFGPEAALERRRRFYDALLNAVKEHHRAFLTSLDPPLTIPSEKLTRWHPEFDLERVPDVECEPLPPVPEADKYTTARDVLSRAKEMFSDERVRKAVERLAEKQTSESGPRDSPREPIVSSDVPKFINPALRNVPDALLQRVKARQAAKALKAMTSARNDDNVAYQKLPDLARTLRNLFLAEKKSILPFDTLIPKLENSFNGAASGEELIKHLKMLASHAPEWLTILNVRNLEFVKILKYSDFTKIITKLESLSKDCNQ